jgi:hypothetical protein
MGTSKRYADSVDRQMQVTINESIMRDKLPISLSDQELELHIQPMTRTPKPEPVMVWVRYGTIPLHIEAELVGWTSRACAVRWTTQTGIIHRAWVWASAVEKR